MGTALTVAGSINVPFGASASSLLKVENLTVGFRHGESAVTAVDNLSFSISQGHCLAIVGESGAGKSVTCRALLGLLPRSAVIDGSVLLNGASLVGLSDVQWQKIRGRRMAMVFQDPARCLNPSMRIGDQIAEAYRNHDPKLSQQDSRRLTIELLESLYMPSPEQRYSSYPHELSGGMRQRTLIAIALAGNPELLIADEATSSLDVVTQFETVALLRDLQHRLRVSLIIVSHDLRLVRDVADSVLVMRKGLLVEHSSAESVFTSPQLPYTRALVEAGVRPVRRPPSVTCSSSRISGDPLTLLRVKDLVQEFSIQSIGGFGHEVFRALDGVSFEMETGETLGIVGESGTGKTCLARALVQYPRPTNGEVIFDGVDLSKLSGRKLIERRRRLQLVFQDPFGSLDPTWHVSEIVAEPLRGFASITRGDRERIISEAMERVGLPYGIYRRRRSAELSGGECQRVAIARALTSQPTLLILDEALSALDALVQIQIVELLKELRVTMHLSYLFISHDISLVGHISDRIAVMRQGRICEIGVTDAVFARPSHPYTAALLSHVTPAHALKRSSTSSPRPLSEPLSVQ